LAESASGLSSAALGAVVAAALLLSCSAPESSVPAPAVPAGTPAPVWDLMTLVRDDPAQPAERSVRSIGAWRELRTAVVTHVPAVIAYPVRVPDGAVLDLAYTVTAFGEIVDNVPPVQFHVVLTDEAGIEHALLDRVVDVRALVLDRRWFDARIDLTPWAGVAGTLAFRADTEHPSAGAPPALALFSAPRIIQGARADAPSLLLITIDCLRADHVHAYGYHRQTTPAIDRLSTEGVRFDHAYTSAPMTIPSLPQLFTSKVFPTSSDATWLAPFAAAGVPSAAIVNNIFLALWHTFGRDPQARDGFDRFDGDGYRDAREITDEAITWLDRHRGTRFALYLHYLDAHSPYLLVPVDADVFGDPAYAGPVTRSFNDVGAPTERYTPGDRQRVVDWYDAGIHWVDQNLVRLIDHLRAEGRLDRTIVVVTADHGEELWDHGRFFHGQSLHDELLHVPLVVRLPGGAYAGTVVERAVRSIDVAPAILEWANLPVPASFTGRSLAQAMARPDEPADVLVATATVPQFPTRYGLRTPRAKLVETIEDGQRVLFDLAADPGEHHDVLEGEPALAKALGEQLVAARRDLWGTGFQLRVVGAGGDYRLRLKGVPSGGAFATLDRTGAAQPRLALVRNAEILRVIGTAGREPFALRFDRQSFGEKNDPIDLTIEAAGGGEVRLGADGHVLSGTQLKLLAPELEASAEPPCPAPAAGVRVCLWRWPRAGVAATPPARDAEAQERLRALGYVQ
jgi:arylsulfatase A-like enzyme